MKKLIIFSIVLMLNACAQFGRTPEPQLIQIKEVSENPVPGTVSEVWVEPMYDTIKVPGQLDPSATYYRLPHRTVTEIRPERFQRVQYPANTQSDVLKKRVLKAE